MRGGGPGGGLDLFLGGFGPGVGDVRPQGVVEEEGLLGDEGDALAQGGEGQVADVPAIQGHPSPGHVVEARDQVQEGRLSPAGGADQGHDLPALHGQADARQDFGSLAVGEADVLEGHAALAPGGFDGAQPVANLGLHVQGGVEPPGGRQALSEDRLQVGQLAQGLRREGQGTDEGDEGAGVHSASLGPQAGPGDHRSGDQGHQGLGGGRSAGPGVGTPDQEGLAAVHHLRDPGLLEGFTVLDLDHPDAVEALHYRRG